MTPSVWMFPAVTSPGPLTLIFSLAGLAGVHFQKDLLEVQNDVRDVFDDAGQVAELVQGSLDLHRGNRRPFERGKQHPAQRVANGPAIAGLEGFRDVFCVGLSRLGLVFDDVLRHFETA